MTRPTNPLSPKDKKERIDALAASGGSTTATAVRGPQVSDAGTVDDDEGVSLWRSAWQRLRRNVLFLIGATIIVAFLVLSVVAPWIAPHDPSARLLIDEVSRQSNPVSPPRPGFPLGADDRGRDLLSRLIVGSRQTLMVGVLATLGGLVGGVTLGTLAGAFGGWVDAAVMRVVDVLLSIPSLLMAFTIAAMFARPSQWTVITAIAVVQIPIFARLLRGSMLAQRGSDHVLAATALGVKKGPIVFRHMLPNSIGPVIVQATLVLATAIIDAAALSFLGLGNPDDRVPEWGQMLGQSQQYFNTFPHLAYYPALCIIVVALGFTLVGESMREALDPSPDGEVAPLTSPTSSTGPTTAAGRPAPRAPRSASHGEPLLQVEDLSVTFGVKGKRPFRAVDGITFDVAPGQTVGLVGESGCGKSVTSLAIMRLLPERGNKVSGRVRFAGDDLLTLSGSQMRDRRGAEMAMIFQDPLSSLNPVVPLGVQVGEVIVRHKGANRDRARKEATAMLEKVGIPDPTRRLKDYPHQLSGGMRQRALIAMALACEPRLLIADEPTTALDVTIQAQILALLRDLVTETGTALIMITHDLGVVAGLCDEVNVLYGGRIVEQAQRHELFANPRHPYTHGLLASIPRLGGERERLSPVPGSVADNLPWDHACAFAPRCVNALDTCLSVTPALETEHPGDDPADPQAHLLRCHNPMGGRE